MIPQIHQLEQFEIAFAKSWTDFGYHVSKTGITDFNFDFKETKGMILSKCGSHPWVNRVFNFKDPELLEETIDYYHQDQTDAVLQIAPYNMTEELAQKMVKLSGFPYNWVSTLYMPSTLVQEKQIDGYEFKSDVTPIEYAKGFATGFSISNERRDHHQTMISSGFGHDKYFRFVATKENEIIAAAGLHVHNEFASFMGTVTNQEHRGKGIQNVLISRRQNFAFNLGKKILLVETSATNNSERNIRRNGFNLAYTKSLWKFPYSFKKKN